MLARGCGCLRIRLRNGLLCIVVDVTVRLGVLSFYPGQTAREGNNGNGTHAGT